MAPDAHERFQKGLIPHLTDVLSPEEAAWMDTHAAECAECRALLSRVQVRIRELGDASAHVPVAMLSTFLREPGQLTPLEAQLVERHLAACAECHSDMEEMARFAGLPPRWKAPGPPSRGWGGMGLAGLAAAAVVVAVLLVRREQPPSVSPPASRPQSPAPSVPAPSLSPAREPFLVFPERLRGQSGPSPPTDSVGSGARSVRIRLPAIFLRPGSRVLITVSRVGGVEVARQMLDALSVGSDFRIEAAQGAWSPGDYVLRVVPEAGTDTVSTRSFPFRLLATPR